MSLTEQQVEAVLAESLKREMWELDIDGNPPRDFKDREKAALELIRQCELAFAAGNTSEAVATLLNIAATEPNSNTGETMAAEATTDLSEHPVEALRKFEETLAGYPQTEEVTANLALVRAEIARKEGVPAPAPVAAAPVAAAPEPVVAAAPPAVDRSALEDQIGIKLMRAHGIDPSQIDGMTIEDLEWVIAHPNGPENVQAVAPPAPPVPVQHEPSGETVVTTQMVINRDLEPVAEVATLPVERSVDPREELEGQVTGKILKAYGRGRLDVPELGDNELRFMIENPEGRVLKEDLEAAQALDAAAVPVVAETPQPPTIAEQRAAERAEAKAAPQEEAPPVEPEPIAEMDEIIVSAVPMTSAMTPIASPEMVARIAARHVAEADLYQALADGPDRAQEIIEREHFPIPEDVDKPPRMPSDMTSLSRDELYQLHARFHAVESRANWVLGIEEDTALDLKRLLDGREVEVANSLPQKDPDDGRKNLTIDQRAAMIAADPEVKRIKTEIHEQAKVVRRLTRLRDGYHRDVDRASRQMNRFAQERDGAR